MSPPTISAGSPAPNTTPHFHVTVTGVLSNTNATCPYRGAGRPEASYCIERIIDIAARQEVQTKQFVDVALGIAKSWRARHIAGELTSAQAQAGAIAALRPLRDGGAGYVFILRYDGVVVLHDPDPRFEGTNRIETRDTEGVPVVRLQIKAAKNGGGFVHYRFPRPGSDQPIEKVAYAGGFDPWQWAVCTSVYVDDQ
jgi:methyl-accepting chemotaxis protein